MQADWENTALDLMDEKFWDDVAPDYDAEICNTLKSDRNGRLRQTVQNYASGKNLAIDFGCGVGRFLPLLSECAKRVIATDFSAKSIQVARFASEDNPSVEFQKHDLISDQPRIGKADVGLLVNVLIMPNAEHRTAIIGNVRRNLKRGAPMIVAVPSIESVLYAYTRQIEWALRCGEQPQEAVKRLDQEMAEEFVSLADGSVRIGETATKHFLREELITFFKSHKFTIVDESRIEYDWEEEFAEPPDWLGDPYPWDWLFIVKK